MGPARNRKGVGLVLLNPARSQLYLTIDLQEPRKSILNSGCSNSVWDYPETLQHFAQGRRGSFFYAPLQLILFYTGWQGGKFCLEGIERIVDRIVHPGPDGFSPHFAVPGAGMDPV